MLPRTLPIRRLALLALCILATEAAGQRSAAPGHPTPILRIAPFVAGDCWPDGSAPAVSAVSEALQRVDSLGRVRVYTAQDLDITAQRFGCSAPGAYNPADIRLIGVLLPADVMLELKERTLGSLVELTPLVHRSVKRQPRGAPRVDTLPTVRHATRDAAAAAVARSVWDHWTASTQAAAQAADPFRTTACTSELDPSSMPARMFEVFTDPALAGSRAGLGIERQDRSAPHGVLQDEELCAALRHATVTLHERRGTPIAASMDMSFVRLGAYYGVFLNFPPMVGGVVVSGTEPIYLFALREGGAGAGRSLVGASRLRFVTDVLQY